jgi:hypothetical protein
MHKLFDMKNALWKCLLPIIFNENIDDYVKICGDLDEIIILKMEMTAEYFSILCKFISLASKM